MPLAPRLDGGLLKQGFRSIRLPGFPGEPANDAPYNAMRKFNLLQINDKV